MIENAMDLYVYLAEYPQTASGLIDTIVILSTMQI